MLVEHAAADVGLHLNAAKTEDIVYNQQVEVINSMNGEEIKCVNDFKYLGSWIDSTLKNINVRKAQAWVGCNKNLEVKSKKGHESKTVRFHG